MPSAHPPEPRIRHDSRVNDERAETAADRRRRFMRIRAGQLLGLLFLIGPLSDLADASLSTARLAAISVLVAVFVALFLVLLPPAHAIARRGQHALVAGLALLAVLAGATLALGAPSSFAGLYVYFVAAAGLLLSSRAAAPVIAITAVAVGGGLGASGADSSVVASYSLTIVTIGVLLASLGHHSRTIRELQAAREEIARLAVFEERLRISRDLHDLLGHTLSLVALKSELAAKLLRADPDRAQAELEDVQRVTRQALYEVREAVHGYRRLAFADALDGARTALAAAGIDVRVDGSAEHLPDEVENVLAWALREATTNVVRHSGARTCEITLASDDHAVALQVDDDGMSDASAARNGAGLTGLAERARRLHGTLETGARPGGGFRVRLRVPLGAT
jgi:two-component system, NarL family, sensor histidine kinase DesK